VLRERHLAGTGQRLDEGVLVQVGTGEHAADAALGLVRELRRRGDDRRVTWAVDDRSREVPAGDRCAVVGSAGWYDALATCRWVLLAGDVAVPGPLPGQSVLRVGRGYPIDDVPPPAELPESPWDHSWLTSGRARHALLIDGDPSARRAATRSAFGLDDSCRALLWAPAWRRSATDGRSRPVSGPLDLQAVLGRLPEDIVVLLAGGMPPAVGARGPQVVDLRWHPRLDEVVLACDAAVTESASLMADCAVAGRPWRPLDPTTGLADVLALLDEVPAEPEPLVTAVPPSR
jgi:CDP-glycerol glycerophosphotransferase